MFGQGSRAALPIKWETARMGKSCPKSHILPEKLTSQERGALACNAIRRGVSVCPASELRRRFPACLESGLASAGAVSPACDVAVPC